MHLHEQLINFIELHKFYHRILHHPMRLDL